MYLPLYRVRFFLYAFFLLWTILLLGLTIARLAYTEHLPKGDPLNGGVNFYDPSVVALLVSAILGFLFAPFMLYTLERHFTHHYFTTLAFEVTALFLLWILWLGSAAAATSVWPDLSFCVQWRACTNLQAMVAFAWLGWIALTMILAITTFAAMRHALWHEHAHGPWADESFMRSRSPLSQGRSSEHPPPPEFISPSGSEMRSVSNV